MPANEHTKSRVPSGRRKLLDSIATLQDVADRSLGWRTPVELSVLSRYLEADQAELERCCRSHRSGNRHEPTIQRLAPRPGLMDIAKWVATYPWVDSHQGTRRKAQIEPVRSVLVDLADDTGQADGLPPVGERCNPIEILWMLKLGRAREDLGLVDASFRSIANGAEQGGMSPDCFERCEKSVVGIGLGSGTQPQCKFVVGAMPVLGGKKVDRVRHLLQHTAAQIG